MPRRRAALLFLAVCICAMLPTRSARAAMDAATLERWSAPFRNWTYRADPVIPSAPNIPGYESFTGTDVPTVYQLPGDNNWYMSFIAFNGGGYNSFVAQSTDLVHWSNPQLAMGFGTSGEFDYGGRVVGGYLYETSDIRGPRTLKKSDGKYWSLYGAYPRRTGYEAGPGYEGLASSDDGMTWSRAKSTPILSVYDSDVGAWEAGNIYQPCLVEHDGVYYNFYNAGGTYEQIGVATSTNLTDWTRVSRNPVVRIGNCDYDTVKCGDPKVFWDRDHWVMFYFGFNGSTASIMTAYSTDLLDWSVATAPLYVGGGNPSGLDNPYAHKISLAFNPNDNKYYMYYCAVGNQGRCIGLITSDVVPEPSVIVMLATGLIAASLLMCQRQRMNQP